MGKKLTEQEKRERKQKREADKKWRLELCVELMNDAIPANALESGVPFDYLSPTFIQLMRKFIR